MASRPFTVRLTITGLEGTLRALREMGPEADRAIKDRSQELSELLERRIKDAGRREGVQAGILDATVRAQRGRAPQVVAGGPRRIGRRHAAAGALIMGSEFGSDHYHQFKPHSGRSSYWFYATVEREGDAIDRKWNQAADDILRAFSRT